MDETKIVDSLGEAASWFANNNELILQYLLQFIVAAIILVAGNILSRAIANAMTRIMQTRDLDPTVTLFLSSIIRYGVLAVAIIAALGHLGVQTTSMIAVVGAAGITVGLALQGSLSNLAAGVLLIIFRPFRTGEYVDLGGAAGTVKNIQIFSSTLFTSDGRVIVVPNSKIISGNIINFTREPNRRVEIIIGVDYKAKIDQVKQVLGDIVQSEPRVIAELGTTIRLNELGDSSLKFIVRVWTTNADFWPVYFDLLERFKQALDENNIGIPYPTMDVNLHQGKSAKEQ